MSDYISKLEEKIKHLEEDNLCLKNIYDSQYARACDYAGEAARLRSALERIHYLVLTDLDAFEKLVKRITSEAFSGDTDPLGGHDWRSSLDDATLRCQNCK
ncbi:hypothetical protein [Paenibacillus sp. GXUN7292]|uniref:hypothetical protein n=1 Tax=Paenibacillus sp. GXUN7292 TaxID=3422499 RepID=UPI003D7DE82B